MFKKLFILSCSFILFLNIIKFSRIQITKYTLNITLYSTTYIQQIDTIYHQFCSDTHPSRSSSESILIYNPSSSCVHGETEEWRRGLLGPGTARNMYISSDICLLGGEKRGGKANACNVWSRKRGYIGALPWRKSDSRASEKGVSAKGGWGL